MFRTSLAVLFCTAAFAADWPQFRGPNGSGIAEGTGYPVEFGPGKNVIWKTDLPRGLSSPVIYGDRLYLTGLEGERLVTLALDRATGKVEWRQFAERRRSEKLHQLNHPASPSVAADSRNVVVFFPDFGLINYTPAGKEQWRVPLGPFDNLYGMGASPVLAGDRVILVCDQNHNSFLAAFAIRNGEQLWRTARPEAQSGHSTPVLYKNWIIAPGSFRMEAYDVATGKSVWGVDGLPGEMKSVPVIDGDLVYVHGFNTPENDPGRMIAVPEFDDAVKEKDADGNGKLSKAEAPTKHVERLFRYLDLNGDGEMDRAEWQAYKRTMQAENALLAYRIGGGIVWKFQRSIPQLPSPLVYRGVLYMVNEAGVLTTLDARSGAVQKQARLRGESDRYYASPVAADGKVYVASHTGTVSVLRAGPEQELLAANAVEDEILATPALADGRVYLRTRSGVWCFGVR